MHKKTYTIYWDTKKHVYSACVLWRHSVPEITENFFIDGHGSDLSRNLHEAYSRLCRNKNVPLVIGGSIDHLVLMSLKLPFTKADELKKILDFELPSRLPVPVEDISWTYRNLKKVDRGLCFISAALSHEWEHILSEINSAGIKTDAVIHPYMAIDAKEDAHLYIPGLEDYVFDWNSESCELSMLPPHSGKTKKVKLPDKFSGIEESFVPCAILGDYVFRGGLSESRESIKKLPRTIKPQRFRFLKTAAVFCISIVIFLGLALYGRNLYYSRKRLKKLENARRFIEDKKSELLKDEAKFAAINKLINKINKSTGEFSELPELMAFISEQLPLSMWVSNFSVSGDTASLTIQSNAENASLPRSIIRNKKYILKKIKKWHSRNKTISIYLQLEIN